MLLLSPVAPAHLSTQIGDPCHPSLAGGYSLVMAVKRATDAGARAEEQGPPIETHIFGTTLMPRVAMPRFYAPLVASLPPGPVRYRAMTEAGGLGRTDRVLDAMRPGLVRARERGARIRLVGHSLGGVVAWVLAHEFSEIVEEVELYGTPVRGTLLTTTRLPVAEARFLARTSRWLRAYDQPLDGPVVRSVYSACDVFVAPPRLMSAVRGERAENHFVGPVPLPKWLRRPDEQVHHAVAGHVGLPRARSVLSRLRRAPDAAPVA